MRSRLLLPLLFAAPLSAQRAPIAPAPSVLFAAPLAVADSGTTHQGIPVLQARVIGGLTGLLIGIGIGEAFKASLPSGGDDPGLDRVITSGLIGMVAGIIVGPMLLSE